MILNKENKSWSGGGEVEKWWWKNKREEEEQRKRKWRKQEIGNMVGWFVLLRETHVWLNSFPPLRSRDLTQRMKGEGSEKKEIVWLFFFDLDFNQRRMKVDELENGTISNGENVAGSEWWGRGMKPDHVLFRERKLLHRRRERYHSISLRSDSCHDLWIKWVLKGIKKLIFPARKRGERERRKLGGER